MSSVASGHDGPPTVDALDWALGSAGSSMIARVTRILGAFDRNTPSLTLTELARRTELPVPTTYRLVSEMSKHGLLSREFDGERLIHIGTRLWELASRGSVVLALRENALPHMEKLRRTTGELVALSILDSDSSLYIERLTDEATGPKAGRIAERRPLDQSSTGLVFLAYGSQQLQEQYVENSVIQTTGGPIAGDSNIRQLFASIRHKGYVYLPGLGGSDWTGLAAPVFDKSHQVIASLSVVYSQVRSNAPAHLSMLLSTSAKISRSIQLHLDRDGHDAARDRSSSDISSNG